MSWYDDKSKHPYLTSEIEYWGVIVVAVFAIAFFLVGVVLTALHDQMSLGVPLGLTVFWLNSLYINHRERQFQKKLEEHNGK
jgi:hypothetical protein